MKFGSRIKNDMIRGFKSVDRLSWEECQELLRTERDPEVIADIKKRLDELAMEFKKKDDNAFRSCMRIVDYEYYIQNFPNGTHKTEASNRINELLITADNEQFMACKTIDDYQHYLSAFKSPLHREEAVYNIDDLFYEKNSGSKSKCERYLAKYPDGRHASEAQTTIDRVKHKRIIWLIVFAIIALIFVLSYHPAGPVSFSEVTPSPNSPITLSLQNRNARLMAFPTLSISLSSDNHTQVSFPKEGGVQDVAFSSRANGDNIEIIVNNSWISASKTSTGKIKITVEKNNGAKRVGTVTVRAWTTLLGVRTSSSDGTIYVEQAAGAASYLSVSPSSVEFSSSGGTKSITVDTDGFWELSIATASWGHITKDGNTISLHVDSNPEMERTDYFELKSGEKTARVNITQATNPSYRGASISGVSVKSENNIEGEKGISVCVNFNTYNMNGKPGCVSCYFYDSNGNALVDKNNRYNTTNGKVAVSKDINPRYDNARYTDFEIMLPGSELHLDGSASRTLNVTVIIWDKSGSSSKELCRKEGTSFIYAPDNSYIRVNGDTKEKAVHFSSSGGRETFYVATNASSYDVWGLPSWCSIENKTSSGFTLVCSSNTSCNSKSDYIKVKAAGKEIRIDIEQDPYSGPSATITSIEQEHNIFNGYSKGMRIKLKFDVSGMKDRTVKAIAWFYYGDNTTKLNNGYGGQVSASNSDTAPYENTTFTMQLFMPYQSLNMAPGFNGSLSFDIVITDSSGNQLARQNNSQFTYSQSFFY